MLRYLLVFIAFASTMHLACADEESFRSQLGEVQWLLRQNQLDQASKLIKQLDPHAVSDKNLKADYFFTNGYLNINSNFKYVQALKDYNKAIYHLQTIGNPVNQILFNALNNKGQIFLAYKEYEKSIDTYKQALQILKVGDLNDPKSDRAILKYNLGLAHFHAKKLADALEYFEDSQVLRPSDKNLIYMGRCYTEMKDYDQAIVHFRILADTLSSDKYKGQAYHNLGHLYLLQKDTLTAIRYFQEALNYKTGTERFITYKDLGLTYLSSDPRKASYYLSESATFLDKLPNIPENFTVWKHLHEAKVAAKTPSNHQYQYIEALENYGKAQETLTLAERQSRLALAELDLERDLATYAYNQQLKWITGIIALVILGLISWVLHKHWRDVQLIKDIKAIRSKYP